MKSIQLLVNLHNPLAASDWLKYCKLMAIENSTNQINGCTGENIFQTQISDIPSPVSIRFGDCEPSGKIPTTAKSLLIVAPGDFPKPELLQKWASALATRFYGTVAV